MSDKLSNLCYYSSTEEYAFQKPYSEKTAETIDSEVKAMIDSQYARGKKILIDQAEGHHQLAQLLLEKEVIFAEDVERLFGKRQWTSRSQEIMDSNVSNDNNPEITEVSDTSNSDNETVNN
jgi:cell division protease FtsH